MTDQHTCRHLLLVSCWCCSPAGPLGRNISDLHPHKWSHYWRSLSFLFCRLLAHNLKPNTEKYRVQWRRMLFLSWWWLWCWCRIWLSSAMIKIKTPFLFLCVKRLITFLSKRYVIFVHFIHREHHRDDVSMFSRRHLAASFVSTKPNIRGQNIFSWP